MSSAASWTSPATLAACFLASPKARLKSEFWVRVSGIGCSLGKSVAEQRPTSPKVRQTGTFMAPRGCFDSTLRTPKAIMDQPKRPEPEIMPPVPNTEPQRTVPEIPPNQDAPEKRSPTKGE